jgi:hypothetical protein
VGPNGTSRELRHLRGARPRPHSGERSAGPDVKSGLAAANIAVFALDLGEEDGGWYRKGLA